MGYLEASNVRWLALLLIFLLACTPLAARPVGETQTLTADTYYDKVHGAWQTTMVANYTGLDLQGVYLEEPGAVRQSERG